MARAANDGGDGIAFTITRNRLRPTCGGVRTRRGRPLTKLDSGGWARPGHVRQPGSLRDAGDLTERADSTIIASAVESSRAEIDLASAWACALEAADGDTLVGLSADDIELVSPRGVLRGSQAVRDLADRQTYGAAVNFHPRAWFQRGETVVVVVDHPLRSVDTGEVSDAVLRGAAAFVVREGRVARFTPYPDLASALNATGLTEVDAVAP